MKTRRIIASGLLLYGLAAAQEIRVENGVRWIHNTREEKWATNEGIQLQKIGTLGGAESENPLEQFYVPQDMTGDNDHYYVLDSGNHRVVCFDANLQPVSAFGRRGQGPGEFIIPPIIDHDKDGNLLVGNLGYRVDVFMPSGEYSHTLKNEYQLCHFQCLRTTDGFVMRNPVIGVGSRIKNKTVPILFVLDADMKKIRSIGTETWDAKFEKYEGAYDVHFALDAKDNIYVAYVWQNRIEKYKPDGSLLWTLTRPVSKQYPSKFKNHVLHMAGTQGIAVDPQGYIWVVSRGKYPKEKEKLGLGMIWNDQEGHEYWLWGEHTATEYDHCILECYSPEGILMKVFPFNHMIDDIDIVSDKLFLLDKIRDMQYHVYSIAWPS